MREQRREERLRERERERQEAEEREREARQREEEEERKRRHLEAEVETDGQAVTKVSSREDVACDEGVYSRDSEGYVMWGIQGPYGALKVLESLQIQGLEILEFYKVVLKSLEFNCGQ